jgi:hypothetical protein
MLEWNGLTNGRSVHSCENKSKNIFIIQMVAFYQTTFHCCVENVKKQNNTINIRVL